MLKALKWFSPTSTGYKTIKKVSLFFLRQINGLVITCLELKNVMCYFTDCFLHTCTIQSYKFLTILSLKSRRNMESCAIFWSNSKLQKVYVYKMTILTKCSTWRLDPIINTTVKYNNTFISDLLLATWHRIVHFFWCCWGLIGYQVGDDVMSHMVRGVLRK